VPQTWVLLKLPRLRRDRSRQLVSTSRVGLSGALCSCRRPCGYSPTQAMHGTDMPTIENCTVRWPRPPRDHLPKAIICFHVPRRELCLLPQHDVARDWHAHLRCVRDVPLFRGGRLRGVWPPPRGDALHGYDALRPSCDVRPLCLTLYAPSSSSHRLNYRRATYLSLRAYATTR
jgi:hypothetical protein